MMNKLSSFFSAELMYNPSPHGSRCGIITSVTPSHTMEQGRASFGESRYASNSAIQRFSSQKVTIFFRSASWRIQFSKLSFISYRRAKLPEGAGQKTMLPRKTPINRKCSTVAFALPVCLSDWLCNFFMKRVKTIIFIFYFVSSGEEKMKYLRVMKKALYQLERFDFGTMFE
jgi:hypothetical protein